MLSRYRELISLRGRLALGDAPVEWLEGTAAVVAYLRGQVTVAANVGRDEATLRLPSDAWTAAFTTEAVSLDGREAVLPPASAAVFQVREDTAPATGPSR